jgi:hypothetical protein
MPETPDGTGSVSWKLFDDLYESQHDLFRKLKFFVKAGRLNNNEAIALESIADMLDRKERELEKLRQSGLEEWHGRTGANGSGRPALLSDGHQNLNTLPVLFEETGPDERSLWGRLKSIMKGG